MSTKVSINPDTITFNHEEIAHCLPDKEYMKDNPVRATLYHKTPGWARIVRRLFWHTDMKREGIEVRQCAWWNEGFGYNGAWDPSRCTLVKTDDVKTTCECSEFGAMAVVIEMSEKFSVNDKCFIEEIIKYIGIGVSCLLLIVYSIISMTNKHVWDMFHVVRTHCCITWVTGICLHVVTDLSSIRKDSHINLLIGTV